VEAAEQSWRPLGALLVTKGLVTEDELHRALKEQEETGRLLGTILVEGGFVSGPALAIALAEQYGVELDTERGFGTGLWAEIDRRHRAGRGVPPDEEENVVRLEPAKAPQLEAVPDPDPELDRLQAENRRLLAEGDRLDHEHAAVARCGGDLDVTEDVRGRQIVHIPLLLRAELARFGWLRLGERAAQGVTEGRLEVAPVEEQRQ